VRLAEKSAAAQPDQTNRSHPTERGIGAAVNAQDRRFLLLGSAAGKSRVKKNRRIRRY
jgi:hypothetical protein